MLTTLLSALCALTLNAAGAVAPATAPEPEPEPTAAPAAAPADTTTRYSINGKVVDNFDGSQLNGKYVKSYDIEIIKGKKEVIKLHNISTSEWNSTAVKVFNGSTEDVKVVGYGTMPSFSPDGSSPKIIVRSTTGEAPNLVYVLDGRVINSDEFQRINPADIVSMEIIKDSSSEIKKKYTDNEDAGVILITTKNAK